MLCYTSWYVTKGHTG